MKSDGQLALLEAFERSAETRRRRAAEAFADDERQSSDLRRREAKREEKAYRQLEEAVAATSEQITHFQERLDRYDAATVDALMDNRRALDKADDALADIRRRAIVLPDGRKAYRSEDGRHVFDDAGNRVGRDVIDPATVDVSTPTWEQRQAAGQAVHALTSEREGLLSFQERVDHAREEAGRNGVTSADLKGLGDDLDHSMPEAVRQRLGGQAQVSTLEAKDQQPGAGSGIVVPRVEPAVRMPAPG